MDLKVCLTCIKPYVPSPADDFGGLVEWNPGDQGRRHRRHDTEGLRIDYSHFKSDGAVGEVCKTDIFLAKGKKSKNIYLIQRKRTSVSQPFRYKVLAEGKKAIIAFNSMTLEICRFIRQGKVEIVVSG